MDFKERHSIYLQIGDYICENILLGVWKEGEKITSIRDLAAQIEVNPNTVVRTYNHLEEMGVISKERGIGYFVAKNGVGNIKKMKRQELVKNHLPDFFKNLELLGISWEEISGHYTEFKKNNMKDDK